MYHGIHINSHSSAIFKKLNKAAMQTIKPKILKYENLETDQKY